uniref:N-acetyltransferase domain-containing protein n=1 Tax=Trichuris muris TaxID=70415 RepID=A0A5S6QQV7_TRIMR
MQPFNPYDGTVNKFESEESETIYYELLAKKFSDLTPEADPPPWVFSISIGRRFVIPRGVTPVKDGALESMIEEYNSSSFMSPEQFVAALHSQCISMKLLPTMSEIFTPDLSMLREQNIRLESYSGEHQLPDIMRLVSRDLSEPYSVYTYRYFVRNWPSLCFVAFANDSQECIGTIVCKMSVQRNGIKQGYIAMLAVDKAYRRRKVARNLVLSSLSIMLEDGCDEVILETEVSNEPALSLYSGLYFWRDNRFSKYYLNGEDAFRLKLSFALPLDFK